MYQPLLENGFQTWESSDLEVLKRNAYQVCQKFLDGPWQDTALKEFRFEIVSGGFSNRLYRCSLPHNVHKSDKRKPRDVLLRIYGPFQENPEVLIQEYVMYMLLSERGFGPKLYGAFVEGRLEEYIPSRSLKNTELKRHSTTIAREMAKIHALEVPIMKNVSPVHTLMKRWLGELEGDVLNVEVKPSVAKLFASKKIWPEVEWLSNLMRKMNSPLVFCHNDLQGGNILLREDTEDGGRGSLVLIDFEFGSYNYRGFDIGNHFMEWCFEYNLKDHPYFLMDLKRFPSKAEQLTFIEVYLDQLKLEGFRREESISLEEQKINILDEVMVYRMSSSLLWTMWAFKMAVKTGSGSPTNFAYLDYGETRWEAYNTHKKELLEKSHCNNNL